MATLKFNTNFKNLTGAKIGKVTVLSYFEKHVMPSGYWEHRWKCRCDCGKENYIVSTKNLLKKGKLASCGCRWTTEMRRASVTKHGMSGTKEYKIWSIMRDRCNNPNDKDYPRYGGRGIKVCKRWNNFAKFHEDMGLRPSPKHQIDRLNNNKNYTPKNCAWRTIKDQQNNKENNVILRAFGESRTLSQWAEAAGMSHHALSCRIFRYGWTIKDALSTPVGKWTKKLK